MSRILTAEEKVKFAQEFNQLPDYGSKTEFARKHGISRSMLYMWAKGKRLRGAGRPLRRRNGGSLFTKALPAAGEALLTSEEIDTLRIENTVLKANLSLAIRRGYLSELTIGGAGVNR